MIHFISSCDRIDSLSILTSFALHCCFGLSMPSHHSTCPSHLQPVHRAETCLDLLHLDHMTMSCLISNELLHHMCEPCNKFKPFHLYGICCSHMMYLWTNHLCISLKHISPPKIVTQLSKQKNDLSLV